MPMRRFSFALVSLPLVATLLSLPTSKAHAWGKRGHAMLCETAAVLAAKSPRSEIMKFHSFDLGYYCNVPDIVWKKSPETYKVEWTNHFMDLEIFERAFKDAKGGKNATDTKGPNPFELDRHTFNAQFPTVKDEAGRGYWRVRELEELLAKETAELRKSNLTQEARQKAQANFLVIAGAIGHYIGDFAQPLHVTENYDGQLTEQKGIHSFFEDKLVDELFAQTTGPNLSAEVTRLASRQWPARSKKLAGKSTLELMQSLAESANKALPSLLRTDKKLGREQVSKAAQAQRAQIVNRLAEGSLILAEIWRRHLDWDYDGKKFFTFVSEPAYIAPPAVPANPKSDADAPAAAVVTPATTPAPVGL